MRALKIHYFLFLAVFMLAAKPFVGFHAVKKLREGKSARVCVKAFTKRKHEYIEGSAFDVSTIQKRLADPVPVLTVLFSILLSTFFPLIFGKVKRLTTATLAVLHSNLFPPEHRYLLKGQLII